MAQLSRVLKTAGGLSVSGKMTSRMLLEFSSVLHYYSNWRCIRLARADGPAMRFSWLRPGMNLIVVLTSHGVYSRSFVIFLGSLPLPLDFCCFD